MLNDLITVAVVLLVSISLLAIVLITPRKLYWRLLSFIAAFSPQPVVVPIAPVEALSIVGLVRPLRLLPNILTRGVPALLLALTAISTIALMWSPNISSGVGYITTYVAMLCAIAFAYGILSHEKADVLRISAMAASPVLVVQSVTTVIFRVSPAIEEAYLRSPLAFILLRDDARLLYTTRPNNVTDPLKAGGLLFVNGNRASLVMAVFALLYLSLWIKKHSALTFSLFTICMVGTLFTSSKTAIILSATVLPFFLLLPTLIRTDQRRGRAIVPLFLILLLGAVLWIFYSRLPSFIVGVDESSESREAFYLGASKYFQEHPIIGLGFGGWAERWAQDASSFGSVPRHPPHNFLLLDWANAGLFAVLIVLLILSITLFGYIRLVAKAAEVSDARAFSIQLAAVAWIVLHGMFDNTSFYGTANTMPVFAALVAQLLWLTRPASTRPGEAAAGKSPSWMSRSGSGGSIAFNDRTPRG